MRALVTGGTGFVGRAVLRALHGSGHSIQLLARHPDSTVTREVARGCGAEIRAGDVLDPASLEKACAGAEAVVHLVGIISEGGRQTFENVHVMGTRNVAEAARRAGVKGFVHMSALGTRPSAVARYHQSKWAAEQVVRASGLAWTIFRPSIIYGPGDGFVNLFARIIRFSPIVPVMGNGESKFQPVPVEAVAAAFAGALAAPEAVEETYDLVGSETLTLNEIVRRILARMGKRRLKVHVPMPVARLQAAFVEFLFARLLRRPPPFNRDQLLMLQEDNVGNGARANELFRLPQERFDPGFLV